MIIFTPKVITNKKHFLYIQIIFAMLAITSAFSYILITNHIWEDFFITFKFSKNLAEGNGLVYHQGERVHGFTSVFNTLIPAFFYYITGKTSFLPALWLYRIISIILYTATGLFIIRYLNKDKETSTVSLLFFSLYFLFITKTIAYTTNGQEAGFLIFFVLIPLFLLYDSVINHWKLIGILWAGLMYTRPDGFIYITAMSLAILILNKEAKKEIFQHLVRAGLLCTAIYLPWFIFTWVYYGTPIPHTIIAKSVYQIHYKTDFITMLSGLIDKAPTMFSRIFLPIYPEYGGWQYWIGIFGFFSGLFCTIYWLLPIKDKLGKYLSLFFFLMLLYFNFVSTGGIVFSWYLTAMESLGIIILSRGIYNFIHLFVKKTEVLKSATLIINVMILVSLTNIYFSTIAQMKVQQEVIEINHRKEIGLWLKENANPNDSVFLEPLGYIGYFSELKMYDFPGLVSPETVAIIKENKSLNQALVVEKLRPDWMVLRKNVALLVFSSQSNKKMYRLVKIFDARENILKYPNLPGKGYLYVDAVFYIYKKIS